VSAAGHAYLRSSCRYEAGTRLAGRAALAAITSAMTLWLRIGDGMEAGVSTGISRLADWRIILLAAAAGTAAWLLARRRASR